VRKRVVSLAGVPVTVVAVLPKLFIARIHCKTT